MKVKQSVSVINALFYGYKKVYTGYNKLHIRYTWMFSKAVWTREFCPKSGTWTDQKIQVKNFEKIANQINSKY